MKFLEKDKLENKLGKIKFKKIGILGGTFDPAHLGHIAISKEAKKKFNLKSVIWAITNKNPFKKKSKNLLNDRIIFAKKISSKDKFIKIKYFENLTKSNKTFDLISYYLNRNKNIKLYFLMGADCLINFHKWYKWRQIIAKCEIIVFDRFRYKSKSQKSITFRKYNKKGLKFINFKRVNISSSKLRKI